MQCSINLTGAMARLRAGWRWGPPAQLTAGPQEARTWCRAQARCSVDTAVTSSYSNSLSVVITVPETISTPTTPSGPTSGSTGTSYSYSTGELPPTLGTQCSINLIGVMGTPRVGCRWGRLVLRTRGLLLEPTRSRRRRAVQHTLPLSPAYLAPSQSLLQRRLRHQPLRPAARRGTLILATAIGIPPQTGRLRLCPNGPADTAIFGASNTTGLSLSANTEVDGIVFTPGASSYTISVASFGPAFTLTISGAGITNNSGAAQGIWLSLIPRLGLAR